MVKIDTHAHWFPPRMGGSGGEGRREERGGGGDRRDRQDHEVLGARHQPRGIRGAVRRNPDPAEDHGRGQGGHARAVAHEPHGVLGDAGIRAQAFSHLQRRLRGGASRVSHALRGHGDGADAGAGARGAGDRTRGEAARDPRRLHGDARERQEPRREGVLARSTRSARRSVCRSSCIRSPRSAASARASITSATSSAIRSSRASPRLRSSSAACSTRSRSST